MEKACMGSHKFASIMYGLYVHSFEVTLLITPCNNLLQVFSRRLATNVVIKSLNRTLILSIA